MVCEKGENYLMALSINSLLISIDTNGISYILL